MGLTCRYLLAYAEPLDSDAAELDWRAGSLAILGIDSDSDGVRARLCWDSHLTRARWIVANGLAGAAR